jgi:hypothetical protein
MTPLVLRGVRSDDGTVELVFFDDAVAVIPAATNLPGWASPGSPAGCGAYVILAQRGLQRLSGCSSGTRWDRRWLPWRTVLLPVADVEVVLVETKPYGAATLTIDDREFDVPKAKTYREPWDRLLGPLFGDRLTVV